MVAQKEIAKSLGISAGTVSRALKNHPDLSKETRDRILSKARELGYFRAKDTEEKPALKRLGVLLYGTNVEKERDFWLSEAEIPRRIMSAVQSEAQRNHIETIIELPNTESEAPMMIRNHTVDGVLLMGRYTQKALDYLHDIPALSVSNFITNDWLPRLVVDNFRGMYQVTEYLISLGHRKILFVGNEHGGLTELYREREKGYRLAMQAHRLEPDVIYWEQPECREKTLTQTAIAASCDAIATCIREVFKNSGKTIPEQCSIAGFDGDVRAEQWDLTTYEMNWALLGKLAVDFLVHYPKNMRSSGVEIVIPGRLVIRGSTMSASSVG